MPKIDNQVHYNISATDAGASGVFQKLNAQVKQLKGQLGGESAFGQLTQIARGAGIAAGFTFIAKALGDASEKADEMILKMQKGEASGAEFAGEIAKSIPLIGTMVSGFESVLLTVTGIRREQMLANAEMAAQVSRIDAMKKLQGDTRSLFKDSQQQQRLALSQGTDRDREAARQELAQRMEGVNALEAEAKKQGLFSGDEQARIEGIKQNYKNIYDAAMLAAQVADAGARMKIIEDIRKKEDERSKQQMEESKARADKLRTMQIAKAKFAREDLIDFYEGGGDVIQKQIAALGGREKPNLGMTAESFTDTGAGALLMARSQKQADPNLAELKKLNKLMQENNNTIKGLREEAKQRGRFDPPQEFLTPRKHP